MVRVVRVACVRNPTADQVYVADRDHQRVVMLDGATGEQYGNHWGLKELLGEQLSVVHVARPRSHRHSFLYPSSLFHPPLAPVHTPTRAPTRAPTL